MKVFGRNTGEENWGIVFLFWQSKIPLRDRFCLLVKKRKVRYLHTTPMFEFEQVGWSIKNSE
jgi:hypothetical protein